MNTFLKISLASFIFVAVFFLHVINSSSDDTDTLVAALRSNDRQVSLSAIERLGNIRDEKVVDALMDFVVIKEEDWRIKIRGIRLLGDIGNPRSAEVLIKVLNDPFINEDCPAMRWNTAIALGNFRDNPRVVDALIWSLDYNNLVIREAVIQSLGKIGDSQAVTFLIPLLNDKSFAIKLSTIKALGQIGDLEAIPFLEKVAASDADPHIRDEALSNLRGIKHHRGFKSRQSSIHE